MRMTSVSLSAVAAAAVTLAMLPGAAEAAPESATAPRGPSTSSAVVKVGGWTRLSDGKSAS